MVRLSIELPLGALCAVDIPATPPKTGDPLWQDLLPEERAHLATLAPARQAAFAAGRVALAAALRSRGFPRKPILSDPRGAPQVPSGALGSISHKRTLAVGLCASAPANTEPHAGLGVDLEELRPLGVDISRRVLTPAEHADLAPLPPARSAGTPAAPAKDAPISAFSDRLPSDRDTAILLRFSLKEAFFKAANGLVGGSLSFQDLTVAAINGEGEVVLAGPALERHRLNARAWAKTQAPLPGHIVSAVRVSRWATC